MPVAACRAAKPSQKTGWMRPTAKVRVSPPRCPSHSVSYGPGASHRPWLLGVNRVCVLGLTFSSLKCRLGDFCSLTSLTFVRFLPLRLRDRHPRKSFVEAASVCVLLLNVSGPKTSTAAPLADFIPPSLLPILLLRLPQRHPFHQCATWTETVHSLFAITTTERRAAAHDSPT
jgi:hypothetical protein